AATSALLCCAFGRSLSGPTGGAMRRVVPDVVSNQQLLELPPTATVRGAALAMRERHVGAVLVTTDGRLAGIFPERARVNRGVGEGRDPHHTTLADVMTADPDTIAPTTTAIEALRRMND